MAESETLREIAERMEVGVETARQWRKRYPDFPKSTGLVRTPSGRGARAFARIEVDEFLIRHNLPNREQQNSQQARRAIGA